MDVTVNLFGQELKDKTYALCKSDIIMKGDEAKGIAVGDTLLIDEFRDQKFNFMLANPPYGVDWKREYDSVSAEAKDKSSRFAPGLPDKSDGQLLFTLHMLSLLCPAVCSMAQVSLPIFGYLITRSPKATRIKCY